MDRDKLLFGPSAQGVDGLRDQFLARAAFALDQDRGAGGRHLADRSKISCMAADSPSSPLQAVSLLHLLLQFHHLLLHLAAAQGAPESGFPAYRYSAAW